MARRADWCRCAAGADDGSRVWRRQGHADRRAISTRSPTPGSCQHGRRRAVRQSLPCDLIAMVNWTMIPNLTAVFEELVATCPRSCRPATGCSSSISPIQRNAPPPTCRCVAHDRAISELRPCDARPQPQGGATSLRRAGRQPGDRRRTRPAIPGAPDPAESSASTTVVVHPTKSAVCATGTTLGGCQDRTPISH